MFETVLSWSPDEKRRPAVEEYLRKVNTRLAINRGLALVNSHKLPEAKQLFESILRSPADDATRIYVQGVIKQIDAQLKSRR